MTNGELSNIHHFSGVKKDCIEFINNDILSRFVDSFLNSTIVINLAFDEDEFNKAFSDVDNEELKNEYKHKVDMWYTLQELEDMGAISIK